MTSSAHRRLGQFLPLPLRRAAQSFFRMYYNMGDCIFCKIVDGATKADIVFRDEQVTVFRDIHPAAPMHILIVPNRHIDSVNALEETDAALVGHMFVTAKKSRRRRDSPRMATVSPSTPARKAGRPSFTCTCI
jgi:galactose-1-phosphate uridylyltransferase